MHRYVRSFLLMMMLIVLYIISLNNYLLFHAMVEIFSVCIAFSVFVITINSTKYINNNYLIILGVSYAFIGGLDFLHTLSYKGMNVFTDYDYYANQLWIGTRYFESVVLLIAILTIRKSKIVKVSTLHMIYGLVSLSLVYSIFYSDIFPNCFIEGVGQTSFKIYSEYVLILILSCALWFTYQNRERFNKRVYTYIVASIALTILSELSFTLYTDNYGLTNMIGHYFKVFSFYLIYKAIVEKGIREPYDLIFKELNSARKVLSYQNEMLKDEVNYDGLTKLYNHRYIFSRLEEEVLRFERYQQPFTVLIIDIDDFKSINDTHGHLMGDEVLTTIARTLKECVRKSDLVGRYGGDEFLVMLVNTTIDEGKKTAENIRNEVSKVVFEDALSITVSIGVSSYKTGAVCDIIAAADNHLYKSKKLGKNQISY